MARDASLAPRGLDTVTGISVGTEWLVDAQGCRAEALRDLARVRAFLEGVLARLALTPVFDGAFHVFPGEAGVTGIYLLTESHLAIHTYPEHGVITINLYCCRERPVFPWQDEIVRAFGAERVSVRAVSRGGGAEGAP